MRKKLRLALLAAAIYSAVGCQPSLLKVQGAPLDCPAAPARVELPMPEIPTAHWEPCPGYAMCFDDANAAKLKQKIEILNGALKACREN